MKRPKLLSRFDGSWYVSIPVEDELTDVFRGATPAKAIEAALSHVDSSWCRTCAGTGVEPNWDGTGPRPGCVACGGATSLR